MEFYLAVIGLGVVIFLAGIFLWRWFSRRKELPCPAYLAWMVDSPVADWVSGTQKTLDRIGLEPGLRVLDAGCATGRLSRPAAQRVSPGGVVVAYDIQPEMIARLQKRAAQLGLANLVTRCGNLSTDQSLESDSFDRAWLVAVLGEIPDRTAALRNIYRVLKPGGVFSITETIRDPHYQRRKTVLGLCQAAGFVPAAYWSSFWEYTQNFTKP